MVQVTDRLEPDPKRHRRYEELYHADVQTYEGLSSSDKRAAIEALAAERFDERERLRLEAAEQLAAANKKQ